MPVFWHYTYIMTNFICIMTIYTYNLYYNTISILWHYTYRHYNIINNYIMTMDYIIINYVYYDFIPIFWLYRYFMTLYLYYDYWLYRYFINTYIMCLISLLGVGWPISTTGLIRLSLTVLLALHPPYAGFHY